VSSSDSCHWPIGGFPMIGIHAFAFPRRVLITPSSDVAAPPTAVVSPAGVHELARERMSVVLNVQAVRSRKLAAVRREVESGAVGSSWKPALDQVWQFLRSQPGLRTDGHNIFLYHHPSERGAPVLCDFGVEVVRTFETTGNVCPTETPAGEAVVAVYRGPFGGMNEAHNAIAKWMVANRESAGHSWEVYGDPTQNPAETETTVVYLVK
jgi:effector-binding domain-containing protein